MPHTLQKKAEFKYRLFSCRLFLQAPCEGARSGLSLVSCDRLEWTELNALVTMLSKSAVIKSKRLTNENTYYRAWVANDRPTGSVEYYIVSPKEETAT